MTPTTIFLINYLYVTAMFLRVKHLVIIISGHHCTVTRRIVSTYR